MEVQGPRNPGRTGSNRAEGSHGATRRPGRENVDEQEPLLDRIETGDSRVIDRYLAEMRDGATEREAEIESRREELLALAEDPAAIRRAAIAVLRRALDDGHI